MANRVQFVPVSAESPLPQQPIFVETTALYDLVLGSPTVRRELEELLTGHDRWSSTYVLMEFRRTAVHALDVVRRLAAAAPDDVNLFAWILRAIQHGRGGRSGRLTSRQQHRSIDVTSMVMEQLDGMPAVATMVVSLLDTVIIVVNDLGWAGVGHIIDETDCDLVHEDRPQGRNWPLRCNVHRTQCRQSTFLEGHRLALTAVLDECEGDATFDDNRMLSVLRAVLAATPLNAAGERRCWSLGDLILVLEARQAGKLISSNGKHIAPMCRALGVTLLTYTP